MFVISVCDIFAGSEGFDTTTPPTGIGGSGGGGRTVVGGAGGTGGTTIPTAGGSGTGGIGLVS